MKIIIRLFKKNIPQIFDKYITRVIQKHKDEKILARDVAVAYAEIDARLKLISSDKDDIHNYFDI